MKRLVGAAAIVLVAVVLYRPASGQDTLETRVAALETQVADLQTRVAAMGATPPAATPPATSPPANPAPPVIVGAEYKITGTILLHGDAETLAPDGDAGCVGRGRLDGLAVGAVLPVAMLDGRVIGEAMVTGARLGTWGAGAPACALDFATGFLGETDAYAIQLTPTDELVLTFEELAGAGWHIERTIEV